MKRGNSWSLFKSAVALSLVLTAGSAQAVLISGDLAFSGSFDPTLNPVNTATVIDSYNPMTRLLGPATTGDFASLAISSELQEVGTLNLLTPLASQTWFQMVDSFPAPPGNVVFEFTITEISAITRIPSPDTLSFDFRGIVSGAGFENTPFFGEFSAQGGRSWSANLSTVPLPAALPLFLSGLVGMGVIARRRKAPAA